MSSRAFAGSASHVNDFDLVLGISQELHEMFGSLEANFAHKQSLPGRNAGLQKGFKLGQSFDLHSLIIVTYNTQKDNSKPFFYLIKRVKVINMKRFDIITIFPEIFDSYFGESIVKRAQESGAIEIQAHNLRDHTENKHRNVDDTPYGGGAGMVMTVEPIFNCINAIKKSSVISNQSSIRTILFSAKGKRYTQKDAERLAQYDRLILICGRYEGVDERVAQHLVDEEISIGDFVLTGGEISAMLVVDSVTRLLPGVLGNDQSAVHESHSEDGYLEHAQYTKPEEFNGWKVPEVLLSGNHKKIEKWREENAGGRK